MSTSRRRAIPPLPVAQPAGGGEITAAFEREKQRFLTRHAAQCPYLLVQVKPDLPNRRLTLVASYALSLTRNWQHVETQVPLATLGTEAGPEPVFAEAFARLDDGISAARIARLFSPRSTAQRMAAGRA